MRSSSLIGLTALAALGIAGVAAPALAQSLRIVEIDVDDSGTLFVGPTGTTLLFDSGLPGSGAHIIQVMQSLGVTRLDYYVAGHYHEDHIGGIDEVINGGYPIQKASYDRGSNNIPPNNTEYPQYVAAVGSKRTTMTLGQKIDLGGGCVFTCIAIDGKTQYGTTTPTGENDRSIALVLRYGTFDYFIGSDLTGGGLWAGSPTADVESLAVLNAGDADVYTANHHGLDTSTNQTLVDVLRPEYALINPEANSIYHEPDQVVLDRLTNAPTMITLWQTTASNGGTSPKQVIGGDITLESDGTNVTFSTSMGQYVATQTDGVIGIAAPYALAASGTKGQISLSWTDYADNETGFEVWRSYNGLPYQLIAKVPANTTSFVDSGVKKNRTYSYEVRAHGPGGSESQFSNVASALPR